MHDHHIMANLLAYNLPTNQLIQINSIRLYLKVNLLSKIVDHTRQQILPKTLKPSKQLEDITTLPVPTTVPWNGPNKPSLDHPLGKSGKK